MDNVARVQIPPSPPKKDLYSYVQVFFCLVTTDLGGPDAVALLGKAQDAITSKNACGQAKLARICIFAKLLFKRNAFETTFLN